MAPAPSCRRADSGPRSRRAVRPVRRAHRFLVFRRHRRGGVECRDGRAGPRLPRKPAATPAQSRRGLVAGPQQRPLRRLDLVRRPPFRRAADAGRRLRQHRRHGADGSPPFRRHRERRPRRPGRGRRGATGRGNRRARAAGSQLRSVVQRRRPPAPAARSPAPGGGRRVLVVAHPGRHVRQDRLRHPEDRHGSVRGRAGPPARRRATTGGPDEPGRGAGRGARAQGGGGPATASISPR